MTFDWWTLGLQAVNFLVLVWLLRRFLYRPARDVIEKRKALARQAFTEAEAAKADAEAAKTRFEDDRARLAEERQKTLTDLHKQMEAERETALAAARKEADALIAEARKSVEEEREAALEGIRDDVADLAAEMAAGILRETGGGDGAVLARLEKQLAELPGEERERLRRDLSADGAAVTVATSDALPEEARARWTERLRAVLGDDAAAFAVTFDADPDILGGAELRFPHATLGITWADQLRNAKELLRKDAAS